MYTKRETKKKNNNNQKKKIAEPVSRVIIRDPDATAEDFVATAARLGLHGTNYVVGWTASSGG